MTNLCHFCKNPTINPSRVCKDCLIETEKGKPIQTESGKTLKLEKLEQSGGPTEEQRAWVKDLISRYRGQLFLHKWTIDVEYMVEDCERQSYAEALVNWKYFHSSIRIYPSFWVKLSDEERELCLIHELCHCHTEELLEMGAELVEGKFHPTHSLRDANEKLTETMARIVFYGVEK